MLETSTDNVLSGFYVLFQFYQGPAVLRCKLWLTQCGQPRSAVLFGLSGVGVAGRFGAHPSASSQPVVDVDVPSRILGRLRARPETLDQGPAQRGA